MRRRRAPIVVTFSVEERKKFVMFFEVMIKIEKRIRKAKTKTKDSSSLKWSSIHFYLENLYAKIFGYNFA